MPRTYDLFAVLTLLAVMATPSYAADPPQLGKSSVKEVIAVMTKEEKVNLVIGTGMDLPPGLNVADDMARPVVGVKVESVPGAAGTTFPIPRLGIPAVILADGPAGLRIQPKRPGDDTRTYYCTAFPIETLLASSWDVDLVERVGRAMGNEVFEYGADVLLGPALNTHRNPLGGRNFEYYSEDPLVSGKLAAAMVKGVQSQGVGVSAKHFVANDHEWNRTTIDVKVSQRALREIYLRGFEIVVKEAQPWTIMSSYNKVNGTYASESPALLTGVLRNDWGFKGLVMSDWLAGKDPVAQMIAGNDLLEPGTARQQKALLAAVESGALKMDVLDRNVERVLELVLKSPTFKKSPRSNEPDLTAHAEVGREAAAQGMVLLKNDGVLPLPVAAKNLALFGNTSYSMITGGTGSGDVNEAYTISLVEGLKAAGISADTKLAASYAAYLEEREKKQAAHTIPFMLPPPVPEMTLAADEFARLAKETDLGLVTIGRNSGEFFDRKREGDFELTAAEKTLIQDVATAFHAQKKKVLVVLNIAGVIETVSWRDIPDAILLAWQPGQESGYAIADVVTGKVPPSGKLATTFPVKWEDVPSSANFPGRTILGPDPEARGIMSRADREAEVEYLDDIWVGYRHYATKGVKTAYPFGYGLSYTTFGYSDLELSGTEFGAAGLTATVTVKNTGRAAGREVVQLYLSAPHRSMPKPAIELRAFAKTKTLAPGESQSLTFPLAPRDLASFDEASSSWQVEAGTYIVKIGASSEDIRQTATFTKAKDEMVGTVSVAVGPPQ
jgi:beta-glucosidase